MQLPRRHHTRRRCRYDCVTRYIRTYTLACMQGVDEGHIQAQAVRAQLEASTSHPKPPEWMLMLKKRVSHTAMDVKPSGHRTTPAAPHTPSSHLSADAPAPGRSPSIKRHIPPSIPEDITARPHSPTATRSPSWRRKLSAPIAVTTVEHVAPKSPGIRRNNSQAPGSPIKRVVAPVEDKAAPWAAVAGDERPVKPSHIKQLHKTASIEARGAVHGQTKPSTE